MVVYVNHPAAWGNAHTGAVHNYLAGSPKHGRHKGEPSVWFHYIKLNNKPHWFRVVSQDHGFFWTGGNLLYVGQCPQSPLIQFTISVPTPLPLLCRTFNGQYLWGFLGKLFLWRLWPWAQRNRGVWEFVFSIPTESLSLTVTGRKKVRPPWHTWNNAESSHSWVLLSGQTEATWGGGLSRWWHLSPLFWPPCFSHSLTCLPWEHFLNNSLAHKFSSWHLLLGNLTESAGSSQLLLKTLAGEEKRSW